MCDLCDQGHKAINVIYIEHTTENSRKIVIPICREKLEAFIQDVYKLRKKHVGRTLHLPKS